MIASDRGAVRIGSAKLVVDGTDMALYRKAEFSLRPDRAEGRALGRLLALSHEVYNAGLEARRGTWRLSRRQVTKFEQFGEIAELRRLRPDVARFGNQPVRGALCRLDEAFGAFFGRLRAGETPGYPRFKSRARFRSIFYEEPVNWALRGNGTERTCLYVQGVGEIELTKKASRQIARFLGRNGEPRTLTLTKTKSESWRAYIGFRGVAVLRQPDNNQVGALDRGIAVTAALPDGTHLTKPPFMEQARVAIARLQRRRACNAVGSPEWKQLNRRIAKAYSKAQRRSENWARHRATEIVARYGVIVLEDLKLTNMTKSAKGTAESPGKGVAAKRGLNRSLQDAALSRLAYWICVKAEEAGRRVYKVNPANSSRQCAACGHVAKENRRRSRFSCTRCGHDEHADTNAAQVLTARGQSADAAWHHAGRPLLTRPVPRNLRRKGGAGVSNSTGNAPRAGSARYAAVA